MRQNHNWTRTNKWGCADSNVSKEDLTLWFCIDYGKLNAIAKGHFYFILDMKKSNDSIGKATFFSDAVVKNRYWQSR